MPVPRDELAVRLRSQRPEIEQTLLARAQSLPDAELCDDAEYLDGFRAAVAAGFDHYLAVIESGRGDSPPIPAPILEQARLAARNSVELQAVVRRYAAGAKVLDGLVFKDLDPAEWDRLHHSLAGALDLLLSQVNAEYERERAWRASRGSGSRKLEHVQRLLNWETTDEAQLGYDLDLNHVALIAKGGDPSDGLRRLAKQLDCRLLRVRPDAETTWAWLGRTREIGDAELTAALSSRWDPNMPLAVGEQRAGPTGWRESHHHAQHVLLLAQRGISPIARYRRDGLLASLLRDERLASSLWSRFIGPLSAAGDRGEALIGTLRAYLRAKGNRTSAAAELDLTRQAVSNQLITIERLIGTPISAASAEVELALRLHDAGFRPPGTATERA